MRKLAAPFVALCASWLAPDAHAQGKEAAAEPPGLDFLEYLGSWQADDKEWYEIAEWDKENRADKAGAGKPAKPRQDAKADGNKSKSGSEQHQPAPEAPHTEERP
jgi:hypothetical protein